MSYIYFVQFDIPDALDAELNRIYDTEHVPMLSKVPGVSRVTRYRREQSNDTRMQKYLAIYEIDSPDIVESTAWEEASAWGDWASKIRPHTTSRHHSYFREILRAGKGRDAGRPISMSCRWTSRRRTRPSSTASTIPSTRRCWRNAVDGATRYLLEKSNDSRMQKYHGDLRDRLALGHREQGMAGGRRLGRLGDQNPPAHHQPAPHNFQENLRSQAHRHNPLSASP